MLIRNLISTGLIFLIISCGGGPESESKVASLDHKQQKQNIMIVKKDSNEFCKAAMEYSSLVSSELLKPVQDASKSPEAKLAEQEIMKLEINKMSNCDQETLSAVNQLTSEESLLAGPACVAVPVGVVFVAFTIQGHMFLDLREALQAAASAAGCG